MVILGIDIGGTKTTVAAADSTGAILSKLRFPTQRDAGPDAVVQAATKAARAVLADAGLADSAIDGVGISCGGPLDPASGRIVFVPNIPGWQDVPLADMFSEEFGAPAWLDNDATLAAFGEAVFGAGVGVSDFVYFQVSTGIGAGIIIGGRPYRGCGNAGEFGHHKILVDGPACTCGDRGCLESLASGTSIAREAACRLSENPDSLLFRWTGGDPELLTAELVARAAGQADACAAAVWSAAVGYLGIGIANAVNIINPRMIILGGGVARAGDQLFAPVREIVRSRSLFALAREVSIVPPALGDDAPLAGAAALALEKLGKL